MESEYQYDFDSEEEFWHKLCEVLATPCDTHNLIDDALRSYLMLATEYPDYVQSEQDIRRCAFRLYSSRLFADHSDYVRKQFVHCLLQEDGSSILHITSTFILADAREHEKTFELLNEESAFPRLVDLISRPRPDGDETLHRQLMELLYELSRLQRITNDDLTHIDDDFIYYLFNIIEQVSDDVEDPYHYPIIRLLLVLNEQFMVAAHDPAVVDRKAAPLTNKVMKALSAHGHKFKTFGENIILLLNREDETSLQLLTLKLLYLLFTTPPTYEYFYTNDLHVLVDILIRNLLDLPEEAAPLRHTYLRVFYPLLEHTQLQHPPHYKQEEVRKLLFVLAGGRLGQAGGDGAGVSHFEDVDETTRRLVQRCQTVTWLEIEDTDLRASSPVENLESTPASPSKSKPPALPAPRKLRKRIGSRGSSGSGAGFLAPQIESARQSSLSVAEIAAQKEKPGVITPSRNPNIKQNSLAAAAQKKEKPPPPKARRSGLGRFGSQTQSLTDLVTGQESTLDHEESDTRQRDNAPIASMPEPEEARMVTANDPKKPPPTPKARRWRGKRVKDNGENGPDGASALPSATVNPGIVSRYAPRVELSLAPSSPFTDFTAGNEESKINESPFSPPAEKTLSPFSSQHGAEESDTVSDVAGITPSADEYRAKQKSKRISSVCAALGEARAQALQELKESLEKATIHEHMPGLYGHAREDQEPQFSPPADESAGVSATALREEAGGSTEASRILVSRAILAPPGQAPVRGVPSPIATVEVSPSSSSSPLLSHPKKSNTNDNNSPYDSTTREIEILATIRESIRGESEHSSSSSSRFSSSRHDDIEPGSLTGLGLVTAPSTTTTTGEQGSQARSREEEAEEDSEEESSEDEWN